MNLNPFNRTRNRPRGRLRIYLDGRNEFRWTVYASNGEPMAMATEGYTRADNAYNAAATLFGPTRTWERIDNEGDGVRAGYARAWYIPLNKPHTEAELPT